MGNDSKENGGNFNDTPIKQKLAERGMSQRELAIAVKASESHVNKVANHATEPGVILAVAIAHELDTTVEELWPLDETAAGTTQPTKE